MQIGIFIKVESLVRSVSVSDGELVKTDLTAKKCEKCFLSRCN